MEDPATDRRPRRALVHVLGRARAGDPTTAAARAVCLRLAAAGRPGRLLAADPGPDVGAHAAEGSALADGVIVVHTVDGGEDLSGLLPDLVGRRVHVVHHGSSVGSDRSVLRALRGAVAVAVAADAAGREELRGLGYRTVGVLPASAVTGGLDGITAHEATAENLAQHPGPRVVVVGPIVPGRSLELLLDAFADLVTGPRPSATLSLCGPSPAWYGALLRRRILARGLLACELVSPHDEGSVVARLDHADAVVSLHPRPLDPYVEHAAQHGTPVVAPRRAATSHIARDLLVDVGPPVTRAALAAALRIATEPRAPAATPEGLRGASAQRTDDVALRRALCL